MPKPTRNLGQLTEAYFRECTALQSAFLGWMNTGVQYPDIEALHVQRIEGAHKELGKIIKELKRV
jgi:hypothetical protein